MKKRIFIPRDRVNEAAVSENKDDVLRIEDYFDLSKVTEKDVRLISNDIRVFIPHTFDEILSDEGEILIKESAYLTLPVHPESVIMTSINNMLINPMLLFFISK